MTFMMQECFPMPGNNSNKNQLIDMIKGIVTGGLGSAGEDMLCTADGTIKIRDKETLEISRLLLARVEKKLNEPSIDPMEEMVKGVAEVAKTLPNGTRPADFQLEQVKKPRYSHRGPYKNSKK